MDYKHGVPVSTPTEQNAPIEELDTEFKRKYPPDQLGTELEDSARVWQVYRDEATAYDNTMIDGWSQTLDILLIFAGLFSAVATAFVVESYQQLQPDKDAFMLTALYIIASASNSSAAAALLPIPEPLNREVSRLSRWINGLWFTSILLSLAVALLCILVKQWIGEYRARNNASVQNARHWTRRREMYFQALNAWPVAEIVSVLPVLLHIALFLFFVGAAAFLWTLDRAIGTWIVCMGALLTVFYLCCTLIPLWIPECPTSTPLVHQLRSRLMLLEELVVRALTLALSNVSRHTGKLGAVMPPDLDGSSVYDSEAQSDVTTIPSTSFWRMALQFIIRKLGRLYDPLVQAWISRLDSVAVSLDRRTDENLFLSARIEARKDDLDAAALRWLILSVSDSDAVAVGLQALGALDLSSQLGTRLRADPRLQRFTTSHVIVRSASRISPIETARVLRTLLVIRYPARPWLLDEIWELLEDTTYADASLCRAYMAWKDLAVDEIVVAWHKVSSSVTSTALLLLHLHYTDFSRALELLLCCRLEQLQTSHWDLIIDLAAEHGEYPRPIRAVRCSRISSITCLLEILAQLVLCYPAPSRHEKDKSTALKLIPRLLSLIRVDDGDVSLSSRPFLLRYLAGSHTFAEDTDPDVHRCIVLGLRLAWTDCRVTPALATLLWEAFAQTMNAAMSSATLFEELTLWEGLEFCLQGLYCAAEVAQRDDTLADLLSECAQAKQRSTALKFMLSPTHTNGVQFDSMWSRFTQLVPPSRTSVEIWLQMTEQLVRTINIQQRQHADIDLEPASVDVFFSHLSFGVLKRLVTGRRPHAIDTDPMSIQHFLQHAIELCPQWWLRMLCDASHDCSSDVRKTYADMVRAPGTLPPCHDCSGVPLGWDLEFELEGEDAFIYPWHPIQ